ncbi:hypothetical protein BQ9231_00310 [Cedratvirus lausannensis]|uniref:Uncharacterized protein n=1 Tax=Cedratvirus lausannensis TaxID=2023205 RepID=A0A285PX03_9VIRU|nr:hypothetical protein BQ9231_00310 [Cedratvirus lausannensis]
MSSVLSEAVYFVLLEQTDVTRNVKTFTKLRSVCRLFYDLSHKLGTPLRYSHESLQALSPRFLQTTNYIWLTRTITEDISVPRRIKRLEFTTSGDPSLKVSGSSLDVLMVDSHARIGEPNYIPKLCLDRVDTLRVRNADFQEESSLSVKHLRVSNTDTGTLKTFLISQAATLETFKITAFRPHVSVDDDNIFCSKQIFTNLVCVKNVDLRNLTLDNLPKIVFLFDCMIDADFINKPCDLLYGGFREEYSSSCKDNFQASFGYDMVLILDNFNKEYNKLVQKTLPKRDKNLSLYIIGSLREDNLDKLLFWTQCAQKETVTLSISCKNVQEKERMINRCKQEKFICFT